MIMDAQIGTGKPVPPKLARNYQVPYHVFASKTAPADVSHKDRKSRPKFRKVNYKLPENLDDGFPDKHGNIIRLSGDKKESVEAAVDIVCCYLKKAVPADFVTADWQEKFDLLLVKHVRGLMYTLMAPQPLLSPAQYVRLFQVSYHPNKNVAFMKSMKDRLINLIKNSPKTPRQPTSEDEAEYEGESIENVQDDPRVLEWIQQAAQNNCWYMDYILNKVLTKGVKTIRSENTTEDITENKSENITDNETQDITEIKTENKTGDITETMPVEDEPKVMPMEAEETADKPETTTENEEVITGNGNSKELVTAKCDDMSDINFPQLLYKIKQGDDMDSVIRLIDLRLARMAHKIKNEMVLAATRGPGQVILHPRMKQLGLDGMQLKTHRKLHYASVVTHRSVTSELIKKYSIVACWQSRPFKKIRYVQANVAVLARNPFKHLLGRHMKHFEGYKMAAIRSFPPDEEDLEEEKEDKRKEEEAKKAALELEEHEELPPELY